MSTEKIEVVGESMEIRKCEQRDVGLVGAFYDKVVAYLVQNINYPKWTYKEYPSEKSVLNAVQKGHQYMCIDNGEIIGAFVLNDDPQGQYENATWSKSLKRGEYMVCHSLASDPAVKGKGVGTEMVQYCIECAKKQGYQSIRLDVVPDNMPAKRLYEKCGFQYIGDVDLERNIAGIPLFSMYELNL